MMKRFILMGLPLLVAGATAIFAQEAQVKIKPDDTNVHLRQLPIPSPMFGGSYLGVHIDEVTKEKTTELGLKEEYGVLVTKVIEESPAAKAGLLDNDVIVGWNGTRVESTLQLQRLVHETPVGRSVALAVIRNGKQVQVNAEIGKREQNIAKFMPEGLEKLKGPDNVFTYPMPNVEANGNAFLFAATGGRLGTQIQSLTPQLAQYFGVQENNGVLISEVTKGSAAEKAGLKAGDVIVAIGEEDIKHSSDATRVIEKREAGPVDIHVIRDKQEQTITVELGEKTTPCNIFQFFHPFSNGEGNNTDSNQFFQQFRIITPDGQNFEWNSNDGYPPIPPQWHMDGDSEEEAEPELSFHS